LYLLHKIKQKEILIWFKPCCPLWATKGLEYQVKKKNTGESSVVQVHAFKSRLKRKRQVDFLA
jgi:hypothetical protein